MHWRYGTHWMHWSDRNGTDGVDWVDGFYRDNWTDRSYGTSGVCYEYWCDGVDWVDGIERSNGSYRRAWTV
jgi:hypothetical protein